MHYHTCSFISERFDSNFIVASSDRNVTKKILHVIFVCNIICQRMKRLREHFFQVLEKTAKIVNIRTAKI